MCVRGETCVRRAAKPAANQSERAALSHLIFSMFPQAADEPDHRQMGLTARQATAAASARAARSRGASSCSSSGTVMLELLPTTQSGGFEENRGAIGLHAPIVCPCLQPQDRSECRPARRTAALGRGPRGVLGNEPRLVIATVAALAIDRIRFLSPAPTTSSCACVPPLRIPRLLLAQLQHLAFRLQVGALHFKPRSSASCCSSCRPASAIKAEPPRCPCCMSGASPAIGLERASVSQLDTDAVAADAQASCNMVAVLPRRSPQ